MRLRRTFRSFLAVLALLGVLFGQLGIAAHACPMALDTGDCCMSMDVGDPALCDAHCRQGDQSSQQQPLPAAALPVPVVLREIVPQVATSPPPLQPPSPATRPVAVVHCRFLI